MTFARIDLAVFALALAVAAAAGVPAAAADPAFTLSPGEHGMVLKTPDGRTVFCYMTEKPLQTNLTANSVCCLYPLNSPKGVRVVDFAPGDHRHHRGVFLAWHATDCGDTPADFWGWGSWAPTEGRVIKNRGVKLTAATAQSATINARNDWMIEDRVAIEESLKLVTAEREGVYVIDLEFTLLPKVDVTLRQTAFGGFCVKGRKEGKATYTGPGGKIELPPPHHLKPESDWPAAAWYDYTLEPEEGEPFGIAVLDHPGNPPSPWHNLEPIAMVNPCIVAPGPVTMVRGKPLVLRYRLVVHDGKPPVDQIEKLSAELR